MLLIYPLPCLRKLDVKSRRALPSEDASRPSLGTPAASPRQAGRSLSLSAKRDSPSLWPWGEKMNEPLVCLVQDAEILE